jgi:hypothetical protein
MCKGRNFYGIVRGHENGVGENKTVDVVQALLFRLISGIFNQNPYQGC